MGGRPVRLRVMPGISKCRRGLRTVNGFTSPPTAERAGISGVYRRMEAVQSKFLEVAVGGLPANRPTVRSCSTAGHVPGRTHSRDPHDRGPARAGCAVRPDGSLSGYAEGLYYLACGPDRDLRLTPRFSCSTSARGQTERLEQSRTICTPGSGRACCLAGRPTDSLHEIREPGQRSGLDRELPLTRPPHRIPPRPCKSFSSGPAVTMRVP